SEPSVVTVRSSSRTVRYAGFCRDRLSAWVTISSRAVARRITPSRCTWPWSSTKPRGSTNGYSVRSPLLVCGATAVIPGLPHGCRDGSRRHPLQVLADDGDRLHQHLGRTGLERADLQLRRPGVHQVVPGHRLAVVVVHDQRAGLAGRHDVAVEHRLVPAPQFHALVLAALEDDRGRLVGAGELLEDDPLVRGLQELDRLHLGGDTAELGERRDLVAVDGDGEPRRGERVVRLLRAQTSRHLLTPTPRAQRPARTARSGRP